MLMSYVVRGTCVRFLVNICVDINDHFLLWVAASVQRFLLPPNFFSDVDNVNMFTMMFLLLLILHRNRKKLDCKTIRFSFQKFFNNKCLRL